MNLNNKKKNIHSFQKKLMFLLLFWSTKLSLQDEKASANIALQQESLMMMYACPQSMCSKQM